MPKFQPAIAPTRTVHVRYPLVSGKLVLRAEPDWTLDLEAVSEDRSAGRFEFELPLAGEFAYFKPVLLDDAGSHWAQGENFLALGGDCPPLEVYPHFFADTSCSVCNVHPVGGADGVEHSVRVFYPPGYAENTLERYPVLYMQDGQNLFFPDEAFGGQDWKIEETLGLLGRMNLVRKVLVVGVYPCDRMRQYTRPGYEAYGRFFVESLVPWVDAGYRTLAGPEHTAVLGSSLGGVVSFYLGWQYPEVFGHAGAMSATFGYRDDLLERVGREPKRDLEIYLDTGWPRDNYEVNRRMRALLRQRGWLDGQDLLYLAFPQAAHNESAWAMRAHVPFQFFFDVEHHHGVTRPEPTRKRVRASRAQQLSGNRASGLQTPLGT